MKIKKKNYHRYLLRIESSSWNLAKRELTLSILRRLTKSTDEFLDIGCGMGGIMEYLERNGFKIWGLDKDKQAVEFCQKRGLFVKEGLAGKLPFMDNSFDAVIALELMEHLEKPRQAVYEFSRVLKPSGFLIVSMPAFNFFWNNLDKTSGHVKRYTISLLKKELGFLFKPMKISYLYFSAFWPMLILRAFRKIFKEKKGRLLEDEFPSKPKFVERWILVLFRVENFLLRWINFPFGVGIIGVFRNKK